MKEMEQETKVETQEEDQKDDKQEEQASAANLPKTQEELDALIEGRIKREHRKWSRQQAQQSQDTAPQPAAPQETPASDAYQKELMEAMRSLAYSPNRFPFLNEPYIPCNKYHKMFVKNWYLILYQIEDDTVYVDYILDCRKEYNWLIR